MDTQNTPENDSAREPRGEPETDGASPGAAQAGALEYEEQRNQSTGPRRAGAKDVERERPEAEAEDVERGAEGGPGDHDPQENQSARDQPPPPRPNP